MPDLSLQFGTRLLAEASAMQAGDAIRFLFERYRCAAPDVRDGLVLALIGELATGLAMRDASVRRSFAGLSGAAVDRRPS